MTTAVRSARSRLLRRGQRRDGKRAEFALELCSVEPLAGSAPVARAQLQEALARPVRQHADDVTEVRLRIEAVQPRRRDEREEIACGLRVVVAADEEPGLATDRDAAQLALGSVVVELEAAVGEELGQRTALPHGVAERDAQEAALIADALVLAVGPREERIGVRADAARAAP